MPVLPPEGGKADCARLVPVPTLVKGCETRFNIERCDEIRLCAPGYYREDGESLVWDQQECAVHFEPASEERRNHPRDLAGLGRGGEREEPLGMAAGRVTASSVTVKERVATSVVYGDNCLIWCASLKPRNNSEWAAWSGSLEESYDDHATIRDPHGFARALGAMALRQEGLLGQPIDFAGPGGGRPARCRNLPVVYGPVTYVEDRRAYLAGSSSETELIVRSLFSKTAEHRHQR